MLRLRLAVRRSVAAGSSASRRWQSDSKLRVDVKTLGATLGNIIASHDKDVYDAVETLRPLARQWRPTSAGVGGGASTGNPEAFDKMVAQVKSYPASKLLGVARAFTHFLALSNSAENHHRIRKLRDGLHGTKFGLSPKDDSCGGAIRRLVTSQGISRADVLAALGSQQCEIVLTAHPTEVNRKTMLQKHQRIKESLEQMDRTDLIPYDLQQLSRQLHGEIASIWESDELRRFKPTPVDEARAGLAIVEEVLWHAVPQFLRKLNDVTQRELGAALPLDLAPIKLASWMGGDRDGNPNVTPQITLEVSLLSRLMAARLFLADVVVLKEQLSVTSCSPELRAVAGPGAREPYRAVLLGLQGRLETTVAHLEEAVGAGLSSSSSSSSSAASHGHKQQEGGAGGVGGVGVLRLTSELMEPLLLLHSSLVSTGMSEVADGLLVDTIRRLASFGLALMPLDIRQESTRHTEALSAITTYLGCGNYSEWDEAKRRAWLAKEIASKRPLLPRGADVSTLPGFSPSAVDTLKTFACMANLGPGALGAYVISQCQQASDVLAVVLLQQDAGVSPPLRVAPLFETLDDLERAGDTVEALFSEPVYKAHIRGRQEIMVGYSDSAKDAGRLAASWAQYLAQEVMVSIASKHGVQVTFFHGKGGTVGRGGNPALYKAILAHPPLTINGRFRVTEQGEMITQNFGQLAIAERTLDLFTAGVLAERFEPRPLPKKEWREAMARLADSSCAAYRRVVREEPRFVPYFRSATPELELAGLNVGSRPAKRNPKGGVESLRAIPWVFAWTQTRLNLPAWLGVGEAFKMELARDPATVKEMYREWPWFNTLVDLLEMILVKSEVAVAANYDKQLVTDPASQALGEELRAKLLESSQAVLEISGHPELQSNNPVLLKSMAVRNPYVDPLNIIQAELLARLRSGAPRSPEDEKTLHDALLVTINGVANGMRNSG